jgi:hypothetical protein
MYYSRSRSREGENAESPYRWLVHACSSWHCRRPNELPQPGDNRLLPSRSMRNSWQALGVLRKELQREKLPPLSGYSRRSAERPQSSSASRFTAGAIGFLTLRQYAATQSAVTHSMRYRVSGWSRPSEAGGLGDRPGPSAASDLYRRPACFEDEKPSPLLKAAAAIRSASKTPHTHCALLFPRRHHQPRKKSPDQMTVGAKSHVALTTGDGCQQLKPMPCVGPVCDGQH